MVVRPLASSLLALALGSSLGCGSKESVLMSARIEKPALTVTVNTLVTTVVGEFELELALGDYASDPTTVKLGAFSLQRSGQVLLDPLELDTTPAFPITLGIGKSKHVDVTVTKDDALPALATELCAGELQFVGTLTDSLGDGPVSVMSERFTPTCP